MTFINTARCNQFYKEFKTSAEMITCKAAIITHLHEEILKITRFASALFITMSMFLAATGAPLSICAVPLGGMIVLAPSLIALDRLFEQKIDYEKLKKLNLTPEKKLQIDKDVAAGNYTEILCLIRSLKSERNSLASDLFISNAHVWFIKHLETMIKKEALPAKDYEPLFLALKGRYYKDDNLICMVSKSGWPIALNKISLLLASPVYRTQVKSSFKDGASKILHAPDVTRKAIEFFHLYLTENNQFPFLRRINFDEALDLLNLAAQFQIQHLKTIVTNRMLEMLTSDINNAGSQVEHEKLLRMITKASPLLDEKITAELQDSVCSHFYAKNMFSKTPANLYENCCRVPLSGMNLTRDFGPFKDYLQNLNCVSFSYWIGEPEFTNLREYSESLKNIEQIAVEFDSLITNIDQVLPQLPKAKIVILIPKNQTITFKHIIEKAKSIKPELQFLFDCNFKELVFNQAKEFKEFTDTISSIHLRQETEIYLSFNNIDIPETVLKLKNLCDDDSFDIQVFKESYPKNGILIKFIKNNEV